MPIAKQKPKSNQPRLLEKYRKEVIPAMREKFGYKNMMAVPKIEKVVVNAGYGKKAVLRDTAAIEKIKADLAKLTGQKPAVRKAKKSISGFKVRQGMEIGAVVTLRGKRMYDFIDRLISIALPRSRDFHGLDPKSFDERGSLNIGIKEHSVFPEITYESLKDIFGLEVSVVTTAKSREEGIELLKLMGFPIKL
jgi:large subunit ribosomal protein L5